MAADCPITYVLTIPEAINLATDYVTMSAW